MPIDGPLDKETGDVLGAEYVELEARPPVPGAPVPSFRLPETRAWAAYYSEYCRASPAAVSGLAAADSAVLGEPSSCRSTPAAAGVAVVVDAEEAW